MTSGPSPSSRTRVELEEMMAPPAAMRLLYTCGASWADRCVVVGGGAGPGLHASIGARGALLRYVSALSYVWWPRAAFRPVISHVCACVRVPVSGCFTGSYCNAVAMCSPLAHVLRTRSLSTTVVFDPCLSFALACVRALVAGRLWYTQWEERHSPRFCCCGVRCAAALLVRRWWLTSLSATK